MGLGGPDGDRQHFDGRSRVNPIDRIDVRRTICAAAHIHNKLMVSGVDGPLVAATDAAVSARGELTVKKNIPGIKDLAVFGLALAAGLVQAETWKINCMNAGANLPEALGDREGHAIHAQTSTCVIEGGPMDGAIQTQGVIWEHDKTGSRLLSGHSIARKPGATTAIKISDGTLAFVMKDGKPAGWTASGKAMYSLAAGSAAALAGKTFGWISRPTGPRTYVIEVTID